MSFHTIVPLVLGFTTCPLPVTEIVVDTGKEN